MIHDQDPQGKNGVPLAEQVRLVAGWLRVLIAPEQVTELRAVKVRRPQRYGKPRPTTESGFFDYQHLHVMAEAALEVTPHAQGVYFVLNPVQPDRLARRCNRIDVADEGDTTADKDISSRRWLLVDLDPSRDSKVSATDEVTYAGGGSVPATRRRRLVERCESHERQQPAPAGCQRCSRGT
jgi:hypothetical protein